MLKIKRFVLTWTILKSKGYILTLTMLKIKQIIFDYIYFNNCGMSVLIEDVREPQTLQHGAFQKHGVVQMLPHEHVSTLFPKLPLPPKCCPRHREGAP